jgi:Uma2 family endonuclease
MPLQQENRTYTYEDWLSWDEDVRAELVDGNLYMMAPPSRRHQAVIMEISRQLANFLRGKPCKVFPAPFGVHLNEEEDTVFEPDIVVVCDKSKLDEKGCKGAPDFIIEILSPSSARMDRLLKYNKYQLSGVREYWIVDPETTSVQVSILENGRYYTTVYGEDGVAPVAVLPGCEIVLKDVFAEL